LSISNRDQELGVQNSLVGFLNSKGFGGNNATATVISPRAIEPLLQRRHGQQLWSAYQRKREQAVATSAAYHADALMGNLNPIYDFGSTHMIDEEQMSFSEDGELSVPGFSRSIPLCSTEGFDDLLPE
jgi:acetoacetyl-[acyl-carrier protein] synthase